jgi:hypothetical protein
MTDPRNHLPRDLEALHYLDALHVGDLETVSALWEDAIHEPELERMLAELDGALFEEILGKASALPKRPGRRRHRWAVWSGALGTLAAACLLVILSWQGRETENQGTNPLVKPIRHEVAHQPPEISHDLAPLLRARRDPDDAAIPGFVWPLENVVTASTPLDLLD